MTLMLGFGGKPHSGKDEAALAIAEEFPGTKIYSISEIICREIGVKREEVTDVSTLQKAGRELSANDPLYFANKILADAQKEKPLIGIITNIRRLEEAQIFEANGFRLIRFIRLNKNGSPYIARDRDMNDPLETDLDFFNWEFCLTAKTGQLPQLKSQAVAIARSLIGENAAVTKQGELNQKAATASSSGNSLAST